MTDLVPQSVRDLLAFYTNRYPEVRFGDLDLAMLTRAVGDIDAAAQEVLAAEEAVAEARSRFRAVEAELGQKASRALSFLKIFVDGEPELLSELDAISMAMPAARRKAKSPSDGGEAPKRRSRKSREQAGSDVESETQRTIENELDEIGVAESLTSDKKSAAE